MFSYILSHHLIITLFSSQILAIIKRAQDEALRKDWEVVVMPRLTADQRVQAERKNQQMRDSADRFRKNTEAFLVRKGTDIVGLSGAVAIVSGHTHSSTSNPPLLAQITAAKKQLLVGNGENNICWVSNSFF